MANKHEARGLAVWARSESDMTRFYAGSGLSGMNKRTRLGQKTKHGGLARHVRLSPSPLSPLFCTKPCLPARLARFSARFFCAYRAGPTHLGPV
jgi:hypothetical protein